MVVRRGDLLVPLDRNPLELYLLVLCVVFGTASTAMLAVTGETPDHASTVVGSVFYPMLAIAGLTGIVGAYWRDAITGVLIVRAAMIPLACATLSYAVSVGRGGGGWLTAVVISGLAVACAWRAWEITTHVRDLSRTRVVLHPGGVDFTRAGEADADSDGGDER